MKKTLLITTMLFVNQLFSQSEIEIALNFQNTLRSYYYLSELELDNELSFLSNQLADKLLMSDSLFQKLMITLTIYFQLIILTYLKLQPIFGRFISMDN